MGAVVVRREVGGNRNAADKDGSNGREDLCYFNGHDAAEGESDEYIWLGGIDLRGQAAGISGEGFFRLGRDPVDEAGLESFRQANMGKDPIICADAGNKISFHVSPIFRRIRKR